MASCALCTLLGEPIGRKIFGEEAERKEHARLHFHQVMAIDPGEMTIEQMIGQCFPAPGAVKVPESKEVGGTKVKGRSALVELCKELFAGRSKSKPVSCLQCGSQLHLYDQVNKCWGTGKIIEHAIIHLENPTFVCRQCDLKYFSLSAIKSHIAKIHKSAGAQEKNYDDISSAYEKEIEESIKDCFDGTRKKRTEKEKTTVRIRNRIRGQKLGSQLKIQRHLHGGELLEAAPCRNGKVLCRMCSKEIALNGPSSALRHAAKHLGKPLYRCKRCSKAFSAYNKVVHHLGQQHKTPAKGNYVDQSDQFHGEMMKMLDECFGQEK